MVNPKCDNGCVLEEHEIKYYAGLTNNSGIFGEVLCDRCSNGSSQDSMDAGFRGWKQPSAEQINQFVQTRGK